MLGERTRAGGVRDMEVECEQGDGDGDHPVGERFDPGLPDRGVGSLRLGGHPLWALSGSEPAFERLDLVGRPSAVAGHRPGAQLLGDGVGVTADVVVIPQVEGELHGLAVPSPEEGLDIVPRLQDFATVGHLYRSIEEGLAHLAAKYGERRLFVGPSEAQATATDFRWPELVAVTDLASARRALDQILDQGEGPRGAWHDAHFGQFVDILDEYLYLKEANPDFEPARPVLVANVRPCEHAEVPLIGDPMTARCTDLFNVGYRRPGLTPAQLAGWLGFGPHGVRFLERSSSRPWSVTSPTPRRRRRSSRPWPT